MLTLMLSEAGLNLTPTVMLTLMRSPRQRLGDSNCDALTEALVGHFHEELSEILSERDADAFSYRK